MKRFIVTLFLILYASGAAFCYETDYVKIYSGLEAADFSYMHGIDPGQYYDNQHASYSIYPLFRLSSPLYFKTVTVKPGYYALTPREYKGKPYLFIKDNGVIKYTIPIYKKELVPEGFYESHIPKPKLTTWQSMREWGYKFLGKHFKSSQKKSAPQSYLEVNDLDNSFVSIVVYYGNYRYYTIFRTVKL